MVTPFDAELRIDWQKTERLIDYLIEEQKSDSLVISGTTGESPTLTDDEKLELFRFAAAQARGRCKIIAGTGSNDTAHSIHLTKEAEKTGVDGILLVAPYYNRPSQEGLYRHFSSIASATQLPVILYNIPGRTGVNISAETTIRLSKIDNIVATKDCSTLEQMSVFMAGVPADFKLYSGDDSMTLPILSIGGYGVISVASHLIGKEIREMIDAYRTGNVNQAASLHAKLFPIFKGLFECPHPVPNPVAVKYVLGLRGIDVGGVRLPLTLPTEEESLFLRRLFDQF
jgi:4-hydroxy-tetrahydrodipicolinate synthase